ncbi:PI-actitoxin-Afv2a-like [Cochliomyia hominivorax]
MKFTILLTIVVVFLVASTQAQRTRPRCPQRARPSSCVGPRDVGTACGTNPPRRMWYYNQATRTCIGMDYLGCGGNANRYCSLASCQRRCRR